MQVGSLLAWENKNVWVVCVWGGVAGWGGNSSRNGQVCVWIAASPFHTRSRGCPTQPLTPFKPSSHHSHPSHPLRTLTPHPQFAYLFKEFTPKWSEGVRALPPLAPSLPPGGSLPTAVRR